MCANVSTASDVTGPALLPGGSIEEHEFYIQKVLGSNPVQAGYSERVLLFWPLKNEEKLKLLLFVITWEDLSSTVSTGSLIILPEEMVNHVAVSFLTFLLWNENTFNNSVAVEKWNVTKSIQALRRSTHGWSSSSLWSTFKMMQSFAVEMFYGSIFHKRKPISYWRTFQTGATTSISSRLWSKINNREVSTYSCASTRSQSSRAATERIDWHWKIKKQFGSLPFYNNVAFIWVSGGWVFMHRRKHSFKISLPPHLAAFIFYSGCSIWFCNSAAYLHKMQTRCQINLISKSKP